MKKVTFLHPFLFAIYPILFLFANSKGQASYIDIVIPVLVSLFLALFSIFLFKLILKDIKKAGVTTSLILILFFSYGHVFNILVDKQFGDFVFGRHRYLMLLYGFVFICALYIIVKVRKDLVDFIKILNVIIVLLISFSLINIVIFEFKSRKSLSDNKSLVVTQTESTFQEEKFPDIYYIIFDQYASSNTLKDPYGYNNSDFLEYLISKDFFIASESSTNYAQTSLSLLSSLNMTHLNYLSDIPDVEVSHSQEFRSMIKNNEVVKFLKSQGYKYVHFDSGIGATNRNQYADINVKCGNWNEFLEVLVKTTVLDPFYKFLFEENTRERVLCTFSTMEDMPKLDGPKFVFAHVNSPHPPYVFGANGEVVPEDIIDSQTCSWKNKDNYLNQISFLNKKIKVMVDHILTTSKNSPIIIIQGDHGPSLTFELNEKDDWKQPNNDMLKERMRVLNVYHLPGGADELLYDSITPVNTFRLIFDYYFGSDYGLLEDRSYFSYYGEGFKFFDVSAVVDYDGANDVENEEIW